MDKQIFFFQKVKSLKLFQVSIKYIQTIDSFVHRQSSIRIKQKQDSVCLFYDSCFFSDSFRIFVCVCDVSFDENHFCLTSFSVYLQTTMINYLFVYYDRHVCFLSIFFIFRFVLGYKMCLGWWSVVGLFVGRLKQKKNEKFPFQFLLFQIIFTTLLPKNKQGEKNSSETKKIDADIHHHGGGGCNGLPSEYSPFFHFISFKFLKIFFCKFFFITIWPIHSNTETKLKQTKKTF